MNAYLPTLARRSEEVVQRRAALHDALSAPGLQRISAGDSDALDMHPEAEVEEPLLTSSLPDTHTIGIETSPEVQYLTEEYSSSLSRATSRISSQGIALGYAAGILLLLVALIPVTLLHGTTFALRLAIGLSGIWWALFSIPAALWLPSSVSVSTAESEWGTQDENNVDSVVMKEWSTRREIVSAWKRLGGMLHWR
jgi:MFS transporter, UMF1 family